MLVSEIIGKDYHRKFVALNILDTFTDIDANYFISFGALKRTNNPYFKNSYNKITTRFEEIFRLLSIYNKTQDEEYFNLALQKFNFPEVNELGIGLAQSVYGKGLTSNSVRRSFLKRIAKYIKDSEYDPNLFMLVSLFTKGVGADLLSDMLANIIKEDIINYTKAMNKELTGEERLYRNEEKGLDVYYLPMDIVDEIPVPKSFLDIDTLVTTNSIVREQINDFLKEDFTKLLNDRKSQKFFEYLDNGGLSIVLSEIGKAIDAQQAYNFAKDPVGLVRAINHFYTIDKHIIANQTNAMSIALDLIDGYIDTAINNCPYDLFLNNKNRVKESKCQDCFLVYSKRSLEELDYDVNRESNNGNGCLDFKLSKGNNDKALIEMKLLSSKQYLHGIEKQLLSYGRADSCKNLIYLVIDDNMLSEKVANKRLNEINGVCAELKKVGYNVEVKYMLLKEKKSASIE